MDRRGRRWAGGSVAKVPLAAGSTAAYGLVISEEGLVTYVDADFVVAAGQGPVDLVVAAEPQVRMNYPAASSGVSS